MPYDTTSSSTNAYSPTASEALGTVPSSTEEEFHPGCYSTIAEGATSYSEFNATAPSSYWPDTPPVENLWSSVT